MCVKKTNTIPESDNLSIHKIIMRNVILEKFVDNQKLDQITTEENGMTITFEFPQNSSDNDNLIKQEIKDILKSSLFEYIEKIL